MGVCDITMQQGLCICAMGRNQGISFVRLIMVRCDFEKTKRWSDVILGSSKW